MQKKRSFCDLVLDLKWDQGQNERYVAHLQWLYNWLVPSMRKNVKRFGLSRAHKVPPVLYKVCRKTKFFVTWSWIWNEVKVKMKGMLHIYNDCTIDWHQVFANMWSGLGWVTPTMYHPYSGCTDAWTQSRTDMNPTKIRKVICIHLIFLNVPESYNAKITWNWGKNLGLGAV